MLRTASRPNVRLGRTTAPSARRTAPAFCVEPLEGRCLLSASPALPRGVAVPAAATLAAGATQGFGANLSLQAGQSFAGYLGVLIGAHVAAGGHVTAGVNWGDGKPATAGIVTVAATGHIDVGGAHTYSTGGSYSITISVFGSPASGTGTPTLLGTISAKAVVAGASTGISANGREVAETASVPFTIRLGSFAVPAPEQGLSATINWGDGTTSAGTLVATGGGSSLRFDVDGTHTFAKAGEFSIRIVVSRGSGAVAKVLTTINSRAVVTSVITGTYKVATPVPDAGATYTFNGTGVTGGLPLTFTGSVTTPGQISSGRAAGALTLHTSEGGLTFKVTGPVEAGFGPFPATLNYVISSSTGGFAGTTGTGTLSVSLNASQKTFALVIRPTQ